MSYRGKILGAFVVPTGIGASIGGFAGDASPYAKKFAQIGRLIVNPNVVNAGCFSGITQNMLYVEGFTIDEFFKGNISLEESSSNKIGVIFDKSIPEDVLNIHINTINAVKSVYGIDVCAYKITNENVGVEFYIDKSGISTGSVKNLQTMVDAGNELIKEGCEALAVVCLFRDEQGEDYANGIGVDPVGGVEAIISHSISKELKIPCAHSPAFLDYSISSKIVDKRAASEFITPTYLPCVLLGLNNAPKIVKKGGISIKNLDYLIMPHNALGSIPVLESIKRGIKVFAIKENLTQINVTNESINKKCGIYNIETYEDCLELIQSEKNWIKV